MRRAGTGQLPPYMSASCQWYREWCGGVCRRGVSGFSYIDGGDFGKRRKAVLLADWRVSAVAIADRRK